MRGLPRFDERAAFTTWMYRVATNACLDELRRRKRRPDPGLPDDDRAEAAVVSGTGPDRFPDRIADRLAVDAALAELPDDFRVAVVAARPLRPRLRGDRRDTRHPTRHGPLADRAGSRPARPPALTREPARPRRPSNLTAMSAPFEPPDASDGSDSLDELASAYLDGAATAEEAARSRPTPSCWRGSRRSGRSPRRSATRNRLPTRHARRQPSPLQSPPRLQRSQRRP